MLVCYTPPKKEAVVADSTQFTPTTTASSFAQGTTYVPEPLGIFPAFSEQTFTEDESEAAFTQEFNTDFLASVFRYFFISHTTEVSNLTDGIPDYLGKKTLFGKSIFAIHIFSGIIVYVTGVIQFTPSIRNRNISMHRKTGKLYIAASLVCISALYAMLPEGLCTSCRPSQYAVTTLWLVCVLLAYYFIRQGKIKVHQQMMISSFICAAYFVTVRIVDRFAMGFFRALFSAECTQLLLSDISAWAVSRVLVYRTQIKWIYNPR